MMAYFVQPTAFASVFTVPGAVVDEHLKLASATQLKVLLYVLRNLSNIPENTQIAATLNLPVGEIEDAMQHWVQLGILGSDTAEIRLQNEPTSKTVVKRVTRPTREDVARRGAEDERLRFLLQEAQMRFGRTLKSSEASTILWLYDDEGMSPSVILLLLQYAVREERLNISFIEKTAALWLNKGVQSVADAEQEMETAARQKTAWKMVQRAFGMEYRRPSAKELEYSLLWIEEWGISEELLKAAYDTCVDAKSKLSIPYIAKILENWHKKGYQTAAEVSAEKQNKKAAEKTQGAAYDIDLFEQLLNRAEE